MAEKKAEVELSVNGAERAAAAARTAFKPFTEGAQQAKSAVKDFRQEVGSAVGGVVQDLGRVVTVGASISFAGAVQGVQTFEAAASKLAVATGRSFEQTKAQINELSTRLGQSPEQIASYVSNVGRATYDFSGAQRNLEAFNKFAKETGRELTDTGGLSVAFKRMGIEDADKGLRQLRATADSLKTQGGVGALADQVTALSGHFSKASNSASQLVALTATLGKGLAPAQAQEVQQSIIGGLESQAGAYQAHFRRTGLLGRGESLIDPSTGKVDVVRLGQLRQQELIHRFGREKAMRIAGTQFGSMQAGAAFLGADFGSMGGLTGQESDTDAADKFADTPEGRRARAKAARDVQMQGLVGSGSFLGGLNQQFLEFSSSHPIAGHAAEMVGIPALLKGGGGLLKNLISGSGGGGRIAGLAPRIASFFGSGAALPTGVLGASVLATGETLMELGAASKARQGFLNRAIGADEAEGIRARVAGAEAAAPGERSEGVNAAAARERARLAFRAAGAAGGDAQGAGLAAFLEARRLGSSREEAESFARAAADAFGKTQIVVRDATLAGISVEHQPGGEQ